MATGNSIQLHVEGIDEAIAANRRILEAMGEDRAAAAISRALNRAMVSARAEAARIARTAYTAPAKKLWQNLSLKKATPSNLHGELVIQGKPGVSLIWFKARPNTPAVKGGKRSMGVTATIKRGGASHRYEKAFVMRKRQGGFGVFVQEGKTSSGKRRFRMLLGPSPVQALERREDQERVMEKAGDMFAKRLRHEIEVMISGLGGGGR